MKKYLFYIVITFSLPGYSQLLVSIDTNDVWGSTYIEEDAWDNCGCASSAHHVAYFFNGDTTISSSKYNKLYMRSESFSGTIPCPGNPSCNCYDNHFNGTFYIGGMREVNRKIYYYKDTINWDNLKNYGTTYSGANYENLGDSIIYDFNLQIGDTLINTDCEITSITNINYAGIYRKHWGSNCYEVIDGIGGRYGLIDFWYATVSKCDIAIFDFYCHNNIQYDYGGNIIGNSNCKNLLTDLHEQNIIKERSEIIPNPSDGRFQLMFGQNIPFSNLNITDAFGRIIWQKNEEISNSIIVDIVGVPKGIYFLTYMNKEKIVEGKKIIIQ